MSRPVPKRRKLEPEMIVAAAAVVVGICALGVSLYQAQIMRAQQEELTIQRRAEVWPNLEFGKGYSNHRFRFLVINTGIGPARIESIRITFDGEPVHGWGDLIRAVWDGSEFGYGQSQMSGRVLPANEKIEALIVQDALADSMEAQLDKFVAQFCYCSVYEDCWIYSQDMSGKSSRDAVDRCEVSADDFAQ